MPAWKQRSMKQFRLADGKCKEGKYGSKALNIDHTITANGNRMMFVNCSFLPEPGLKFVEVTGSIGDGKGPLKCTCREGRAGGCWHHLSEFRNHIGTSVVQVSDQEESNKFPQGLLCGRKDLPKCTCREGRAGGCWRHLAEFRNHIGTSVVQVADEMDASVAGGKYPLIESKGESNLSNKETCCENKFIVCRHNPRLGRSGGYWYNVKEYTNHTGCNCAQIVERVKAEDSMGDEEMEKVIGDLRNKYLHRSAECMRNPAAMKQYIKSNICSYDLNRFKNEPDITGLGKTIRRPCLDHATLKRGPHIPQYEPCTEQIIPLEELKGNCKPWKILV